MSAKVEIDSKVLASKAVILDIEGTTTSISFVKDVLFPYVKENVEVFLKENFSQDDVKACVAQLREQAIEDVKSEVDGAVAVADETAEEAEQIESLVKNVQWQMSLDRKTAALKTLQGLVYPKGYKDGTLKAQVYEDASKAMEQWVASGHKLYIYSSGSVDAQKLLFAHTEHGDLTAHITNYFDTGVGAKQESKSYAAIAKEIDFAPEEVLFLTDVVKEAEAAKEAGLNVVVVVRPGNAELTDEEKTQYPVVESFETLALESVGGVKRKIDDVSKEQQEEVPTKSAKTDETSEAEVTEAVVETKEEAKETKEVVEASEVDSTAPVVEETPTPTTTTTEPEKEKADEPMIDVDEEKAEKKEETPKDETPKEEGETPMEVVEPEAKNGHANGETNGHVENGTNGTTTEEKTVETEKVDESPEELKAKKLAEAEPEVAPPAEAAEA